MSGLLSIICQIIVKFNFFIFITNAFSAPSSYHRESGCPHVSSKEEVLVAPDILQLLPELGDNVSRLQEHGQVPEDGTRLRTES